jgi:hypothetical protein
MAKTHCRCISCRRRKKLKKHPLAYHLQPKCNICGARNWRKDEYRHRVELAQIRNKTGRYKACHCDGYPHPHRTEFGNCKLMLSGEYKLYPVQ